MKLRSVLATLAVCAMSGHLAPAMAQTAAPGSAATAAAPAEVASLDTVVVTTNRRLEDAQRVSGVVQSLDGKQLRQDGISELRNIQVAIPGMSIANQEGNVEIYIRGVGSSNNTELGDPGAASHLNGVYIPRPRGLGLMFYDLDRVEVNKGPQGTLYGRNAMAGTLNIMTAKPRLGQNSGFAQTEVSNRGGQGFEGAVNAPLGENAAIRAAMTYSKKDYGFENYSASLLANTKNPSAAQQAAGGLSPAGLEKNYAGRVSLLWDISPMVRLTAMVDAGHEGGTGYPGANIWGAVQATGARSEDLDIRKVVYRGPQGETSNDLWGVQSKLDFDLGNGIGIEASGSLRSVDFYQRNAASEGVDYSGRDYAGFKWDNYSTQYWQTKSKSSIAELRAYSTDPKARLKWSAGAFGFNEDQQVGYLALVDAGYCCYSGTEFTMPSVKAKASAIFTDANFSLSDSLRVLGGARYTKEEKSRFGIGGNVALTLGGADYACCLATRFGTEGFVPAMLSRPNFNVTNLSPQQVAQFLMQTTLTPGLRDTMLQQIAPIANGTNSQGNCFVRSDIDNGFVKCPTDQKGGFSYANLTIPEQQDGQSSARFGDFRLGLEYDLARETMVFGKVSSGHKAGGFNDSFKAVNAGVPELFAPESVTVFEAGVRHAFTMDGRRALLNATVFSYDYRDQVFQDLTCISFDNTKSPPCNGYSLVNRNVGKSEIQGIELEGKFNLASGFKLDLNATLLQTKIVSGQVADVRAIDFGQGGNAPLISLAGNKLPLASDVNVSARIQQVLQLGAGKFDWQVLASYRSDYFLSQFNEADVVYLDGKKATALVAGFSDRQKGFTTVNLGAGYTQGKYRIEGFANNVTNKQASQKAIVGNSLDVRFLNDARSYGIRGRVEF